MSKKIIETIRTDRLLIRPIVDTDLEYIYKGLSHPEVIQYYGVSFDSLEATQEQMEWYASPEQCWWAICALDNQEFYGAGGLNGLSNEHRKAEIGLWLLPAFWGKGIMAEVMPLICEYGFNQLDLDRIEGFVESDNQNCKRGMAKLDFNYEETLENCEVKNGVEISVDVYAKLKD